jgi:hypothetical protein
MENIYKPIMKSVIDFLLLNGFTCIEPNSYINNYCNIIINEEYYTIIDKNNEVMISRDVNIYWLIGCLTYYGYMDKNYKQLD